MSEVIPPLPLVLPLLMAAVMVGASPILRRARPVRDLLVTLAMGVTTALSALLIWYSRDSTIIYWFGGWTPREGKALGIAFDIEPIGAGLATLAGFLTTAALTYSWHYFEEIQGLYHSLVLTFAAGMIGFSLTGDLFNLFVFFELMGVAAYGLTCYQREAPTLEGALNFAVTNSVGAFLILIGIALLYARTSALNLVEIGVVLAEGVERGPDGLVVIASALLLTGFLVKAAAVPFHFWLPDAHAVAPTPVCSLFSGVMVGLGRKGGPEEEAPEERPGQEIHGAYGWTPAVMTGPVIGLLAAALGIGVSTAIPEFYQRAAIGFIGNSEPSSVAPSYTISTIISAAVSTLGALLLAWTSAAHDLSQIPGPIGRVIGWSNQGLELLHSGNVTDYIAWLILGAALLGAILALTAG